MFSPTRCTSSPPPVPERSLKRKAAMKPRKEIQNSAATPTFRYSSGFAVALPVNSAAEQVIENPFSDAMARPFGTRYSSGVTEETMQDPVFDNAATESRKKLSLGSDLTEDDSGSNQGSPMELTPNHTFIEVPATRNNEPFPTFTEPSRIESRSQADETADLVQSKAQKLASKLKGALQYINDIDWKFELWTSEQEEKRLKKRRLAQVRRDSVVRVKAIDSEHRAKIKAHKEKEKARNKRAAIQMKEQKKEMKAQAKRRDKAAKDECNFFTTVKQYICKKACRKDEASKEHKVPRFEPTFVEGTASPYTGLSYTEREVEEETSDEYTYLRGAEEYDPTRY